MMVVVMVVVMVVWYIQAASGRATCVRARSSVHCPMFVSVGCVDVWMCGDVWISRLDH